MSVDSHEFSVWIQSVLSIPRVGRKTAWKFFEELPEEIDDESEFVEILVELSKSIPRMTEVSSSQARENLSKGKEILDRTVANKGSVINFRNFPRELRESSDPPLLLHCLGDVSIIQDPGVAVIGTREPTQFGRDAARDLGRKLAEINRVVVSGLALGCDTGGHEGCLEGKGKTVAVLAHGLDTMYPPENRELAVRIMRDGGLLLSEYPFGITVRGPYFVERDRIQAALSEAVVVIETGTKGGTLHTVGFARENEVPVLALDHPEEFHEQKQVLGNRMLIDEGKAHALDPKFENLEEILKSHRTERADPPRKDVQGKLF